MMICVSGVIGSGKTTLTKSLAERLNFEPLFEPVGTNEYLGDFYKFLDKSEAIDKFLDKHDSEIKELGIDKWMLQSQVPYVMQGHLLGKRYVLHQKALWTNSVQDRSIYEDTIFAKMLFDSGKINDRDYKTYQNLFQAMKYTLMYPDLMLFLDIDPENAYKRIHKRNRDCEKTMPLDYLKALDKEYRDFIQEIKQWCPVVSVDWNEELDINGNTYKNKVESLYHQVLAATEKKSPYFRSMTRI